MHQDSRDRGKVRINRDELYINFYSLGDLYQLDYHNDLYFTNTVVFPPPVPHSLFLHNLR